MSARAVMPTVAPLACFAAATLAVSCARSESTSLLVEVVSADFRPGLDIDEVVAEVTINQTVSTFIPVTDRFPTFGVVPAAGAGDRAWIKVTAFSGQQQIVNTGATVSFIKGETRRLRLMLVRGCEGLRCSDPRESCRPDARQCAPLPEVNVNDLPGAGWAGDTDDAAAPNRDGPGRADASASVDDAASPPGTSAPDAPVGDAPAADARADAPVSGGDTRPAETARDAAADVGPLVDAPGGVCNNGSTRTCASFGLKGRCAAGNATCTGGQWTGCPHPLPADTCSSLDSDDDCDGVEFEGCRCVNGQSEACAPCSQDSHMCRNGQWTACPTYGPNDRNHCGPACRVCPAAHDATVSCTNNDCVKVCDVPLSCRTTDGFACGSWTFESGAGTEDWTRTYPSAWDGVTFAIKTSPSGGTNKVLAFGFDSHISPGAMSAPALGVGVSLCPTDSVDLKGKRLTARAYVQGEAVGDDNQIYWIGSRYIDAFDQPRGLYPEIGIKWNTWFDINVAITDTGAESRAKSIAFTFWIGVPPSKRWKGTIYLDDVKLQ